MKVTEKTFSSEWIILQTCAKILKFHLHHVYIIEELKDLVRENDFSSVDDSHVSWENTGILGKVFNSDKSWFHLSCKVSSQNSRIWSAENPHTVRERLLHSIKVKGWCSVSRQKVIGLTFRRTERYQEVIMNVISLLEIDEEDCWFQQQGRGYGGKADSVIQTLTKFFVRRILSRKFNSLDPRIYSNFNYIFRGFSRRKRTKITRTHQKN
jgi:hypothetical protein